MADNLETAVSQGYSSRHMVIPVGRDGKPLASNSVILSDDFGGAAIDTTKWDVIDGGLPAIVSGTPYAGLPGNPIPAFSQDAIGTGITGITDSVATSILTVAMGTTANAERWYLSKATVVGTRNDLLAVLSRSQALVTNHIFIGFVEVDEKTGIPILNPNLATEFRNSGGIQFGLTATTTAYQARALGDGSGALALSAVGVATGLTVAQEFRMASRPNDLVASSSIVDIANASVASTVRVSSQVPNDTRVYKLLMRFKNIGAPASNTTVGISRINVLDAQETRVSVTGEGDSSLTRSIPIIVANTPNVTVAAGSASIGLVGLQAPVTTANGILKHKLIAAATTNATVLTGLRKLMSGHVKNVAATTKFLKLYDKATAPTVGTDAPIWTIPIAAGETLYIADLVGVYGLTFVLGLAYALTGAVADSDTTALAAGDVIVNLGYV